MKDQTHRAKKNRVTFDYNGEIFTIRANGKLVTAYRTSDFSSKYRREYLENVLSDLRRLIETGDDLFITRLEMAPASVGSCTICNHHANLIGGLCNSCYER